MGRKTEQGRGILRRIIVALAAMACAFFAWARVAAAAGQAGAAIDGQLHRRRQGRERPEGGRGGQEGEGQVRLPRCRQRLRGATERRPGRQAARSDSRVATVEQDRVVTADAHADGRHLGPGPHRPARPAAVGHLHVQLDRRRRHAYVIDTGIDTAHSNFGGRAANVYDALGGNGAATATATARTWPARSAAPPTASPRACSCAACACSTAPAPARRSGIIAALNWVRTNASGRRWRTCRWAAATRSTLNSAANNLANSGVFLAVAAGNEGQNACNVSPASARGGRTPTAASEAGPTCAPRSPTMARASTATRRASTITSAWRHRRHQHDQRHLDGDARTWRASARSTRAAIGDASSSTVVELDRLQRDART